MGRTRSIAIWIGTALAGAGCPGGKPGTTDPIGSIRSKTSAPTAAAPGTTASSPVPSPLPLVNGPVLALVRLADGSLLAGGSFTRPAYLARFTSSGQPDEAFAARLGPGPNGPVHAIVVQPGGALLIAGEFTDLSGRPAGRIARLWADGTPDADFLRSAGQGFSDRVNALALLKGGKILAGGNFTAFDGEPAPRVARLMPSGKLDPSFGVAPGGAKGGGKGKK
jgi:hypothetical protein